MSLQFLSKLSKLFNKIFYVTMMNAAFGISKLVIKVLTNEYFCEQ